MFMLLGNDLDAIRQAAPVCGLRCVSESGTFDHSRISYLDLPLELLDTDLARPIVVLQMSPEAQSKCSRTPHEVGIFSVGDSYGAIWDDRRDGFGLSAYIGKTGHHLRMAYILEALDRAAHSLGLQCSTGKILTGHDAYMEYFDMAAQKKITVRVDKTGSVTIKTEGFEGKSCQDATKQLEEALGSVTSDKPAGDAYKGQEQQISASQG